MKGLKKRYRETQVRARAEVSVLFIVDNLCPACPTGGPRREDRELQAGGNKMPHTPG